MNIISTVIPNFPDKLLPEILKKLDTKSVLNCRFVCKNLNNLIKSAYVLAILNNKISEIKQSITYLKSGLDKATTEEDGSYLFHELNCEQAKLQQIEQLFKQKVYTQVNSKFGFWTA